MDTYDGGGFEEWVRDSLPYQSHSDYPLRVKRVMELLRPWGNQIQRQCDAFDEKTQSWRDYRISLWNQLPDHIQDEAGHIMAGDSLWSKLPPHVPISRYVRKPTTIRLIFGDYDHEVLICASAGDTEDMILEHLRMAMRNKGLPV